MSSLCGSWWCFKCDSAHIFVQTPSSLEELCSLELFWKVSTLPNALLPLLISPILAVRNFLYKAVNLVVWDFLILIFWIILNFFKPWNSIFQVCKSAANLECLLQTATIFLIVLSFLNDYHCYCCSYMYSYLCFKTYN